MGRFSAMIGLVQLLVLAAGCHATPQPQRAPLAATLPATAPAAPDLGSGLRPLSPRHAKLLSAQQDYVSKEGRFARGPWFHRVLGFMEEIREHEGRPLTEFEVLMLLGPPDYGDFDERGADYIYIYDSGRHGKWYVSIDFDRNRYLSQMGYNAVSTIDFTKYKKYQPWTPLPPLQASEK